MRWFFVSTKNEETIISCPNCLVCSIKPADHIGEDAVTCKVCGTEVDLTSVKNS
jgi:hypothetical protein